MVHRNDDHRNPKFLALQREWYRKLAKAGFQDIELPGDCHMLRHYDSTRFYRNDIWVHSAHQEFFIQAGHFLHDNKFENSLFKRIWKLYSEGAEYGEIAKKCKIGICTAHRVVKRLRAKMLNKLDEVVTIRDGGAADQAFIYATMLRGLYYGCPQYSLIPKNIFMANYHALVELVLASPTLQLKVACLKEDPECVVGYSIGDVRGIVHFVFVKKSWRRLGIAKSLVESMNDVKWVTHLTRVGERILREHRYGIQFNPFATGGLNVQEKESQSA